MIDTHSHLDGDEFKDDIEEVILRCKDAGVEKAFIPATCLADCQRNLDFCRQHKGFAYSMLGLHPEEVKEDWQQQLDGIHKLIANNHKEVIAVGEIGLDYYWSREFEKEQQLALRQQIEWAIEFNLPLMIHCRKAQNELVGILKEYKSRLTRGGVFHCFSGNEQEALQLLDFEGFALGIGGILTFKKSHLPEVLPQAVPLEHIVLETDSPYMAPVPMRGQRNESSYVLYVLTKLAQSYNMPIKEVERITTDNALRIFNL